MFTSCNLLNIPWSILALRASGISGGFVGTCNNLLIQSIQYSVWAYRCISIEYWSDTWSFVSHLIYQPCLLFARHGINYSRWYCCYVSFEAVRNNISILLLKGDKKEMYLYIWGTPCRLNTGGGNSRRLLRIETGAFGFDDDDGFNDGSMLASTEEGESTGII